MVASTSDSACSIFLGFDSSDNTASVIKRRMVRSRSVRVCIGIVVASFRVLSTVCLALLAFHMTRLACLLRIATCA